MSDPSGAFTGTGLPARLKNGVAFRCTDCGVCCTGRPGKVRVTDEDIKRISDRRNQSEADFRRSELREVGGELVLKEEANGDCIYFKNNRCSIHAVKPRQCRLYPFWFKNVRSEAAWEQTCRECEGIGQGDRVPPEEILAQVQADLEVLKT